MQLFQNNAASSLSSGITAAATTINITAGDGAKFPSTAGGNTFKCTLFKRSGNAEVNHEIVKVTNRATDAFTVVRAQDGTTARDFLAGDPIELRFTKADAEFAETHAANTSNPHATTAAQIGAATTGQLSAHEALTGASAHGLDTQDPVVLGGTITSNAPKVSAHRNAVNQTAIANGSPTKVQITNTEYGTIDTTNYRWVPNKAGYYLVIGSVGWVALPDNSHTITYIYKNGASYKVSSVASNNSSDTSLINQVVATVYMNGTTDYLELFARQVQSPSATADISGDISRTFLQAIRING